jgi:hypothetical protein
VPLAAAAAGLFVRTAAGGSAQLAKRSSVAHGARRPWSPACARPPFLLSLVTVPPRACPRRRLARPGGERLLGAVLLVRPAAVGGARSGRTCACSSAGGSSCGARARARACACSRGYVRAACEACLRFSGSRRPRCPASVPPFLKIWAATTPPRGRPHPRPVWRAQPAGERLVSGLGAVQLGRPTGQVAPGAGVLACARRAGGSRSGVRSCAGGRGGARVADESSLRCSRRPPFAALCSLPPFPAILGQLQPLHGVDLIRGLFGVPSRKVSGW